MKERKDQRIILMMEPTLANQIDTYRFANRIPTRAEAMRTLIKEALEAKTATKQGCNPS